MKRIILLVATIGLGMSASAAFADSSFQDTCSNIRFAYINDAAAVKAVCLTRNGMANRTALRIRGIGNDNGRLVYSGGESSFQRSCGNIRIIVKNSRRVILSAFCRTRSGDSRHTHISLDGIANIDGNLRY